MKKQIAKSSKDMKNGAAKNGSAAHGINTTNKKNKKAPVNSVKAKKT